MLSTSGSRLLALLALCCAIPSFDRAIGQTVSSPAVSSSAPAKAPQDVRIAYLGFRRSTPPIYDYEDVPGDAGIAGARIAMRDMITTGRLTGQSFVLDETLLDKGRSAVEAAKAIVAKGVRLIIVDLSATDLLEVVDATKDSSAIFYNINAEDDRLRNADCRANVFHIAPSHAMLTDALAQFLLSSKWRNVVLVVGKDPADQLYADAFRRSAKKFGLKVNADKVWDFGNLARERADGPTRADALIFSRGINADMIVVADVAGNFGDYIQYHTAEPKLVGGTQGLLPTTWSRVLDAWGSAQLQSRFVRANKREMRPLDYQAWVAVRAIGEAATRTKSGDAKVLAKFGVQSDFEIAAFKGVAVSFRPWDRQLRQPILLVQPKMLVSVAPEPGFLHPATALDTLGPDKVESTCKFPSEGKS